MSIYSNVTEKDLDNLRKLAQQQKEHRALKIKNRIIKETHDVKLAESLSPITERLDEVKKSTQELGDVIKESQPQTPQLLIKNSSTTHQPIEDNEVRIYDVELENTLNRMKDKTGVFKTHHDLQHGRMINNYPIKIVGRTKVKIIDNEYNINSGLQKVITKKS